MAFATLFSSCVPDAQNQSFPRPVSYLKKVDFPQTIHFVATNNQQNRTVCTSKAVLIQVIKIFMSLGIHYSSQLLIYGALNLKQRQVGHFDPHLNGHKSVKYGFTWCWRQVKKWDVEFNVLSHYMAPTTTTFCKSPIQLGSQRYEEHSGPIPNPMPEHGMGGRRRGAWALLSSIFHKRFFREIEQ